MGWAKRIAVGITAVVVGGVAALALWVQSIRYEPDDVMDAELHCTADAPAAPADGELTVLVWNVQYAGSRKHNFFYDGGQAVSVPASDVEDTLAGLVAAVKTYDPDLILWQEVDRDSRRTQYIDEVARLAEALPYPCWSSAPYFKSGYVPHPGNEFLGQMDMHLATFSKYRIERSTRVQLPLLDEPWWRQMFNLKRAILVDQIPVDDGGEPLTVLNTHLSAFSKGDGTLGRQIEVVQAQLGKAGKRWILGGDFNSLPPGDDPARLGDDAYLYAEAETAVAPLFAAHASPFDPAAASPALYTYQGFQKEPSRTIDYVFHGAGVFGTGFRVEQSDLSDHLPLIFTASLTEPPPPPEEPVEGEAVEGEDDATTE